MIAPYCTMQRWLHHADYLKLDHFLSVLSPGKDVTMVSMTSSSKLVSAEDTAPIFSALSRKSFIIFEDMNASMQS